MSQQNKSKQEESEKSQADTVTNVPELVLRGEQIKQLESLIQEMPTKFGLPLLQFLNGVAQENAPQEKSKS